MSHARLSILAFAFIVISSCRLSILAQIAESQTVDGVQVVLSGRVIAANTARPLARARVALVKDGRDDTSAPIALVSTDDGGYFEIRGVAAGLYRLAVSRRGYATTEFGQTHWQGRGEVLDVKSGENRATIEIAMSPSGVITGAVSDELGVPFPGTRVEAIALRYSHGALVGFPAAVASTDDRGWFRLAGLPPGRYLVRASAMETWTRDDVIYGYGTTYFPSGGLSEGRGVDVGFGAVLSGIHVQLMPARTHRVRGRVAGSDSRAIPGQRVTLAPSYPGTGAISLTATLSTTTDDSGAFTVASVPPGSYRLSARTSLGDAAVSLSVHGDIDAGVLAPRIGSVVSGTIRGDRDSLTFDPGSLRVRLVADNEDLVLPTFRLQEVRADGSFTLKNVGGPFLFRLEGLPDGWVLKSVTVDGRDITHVPLNVTPGGLLENLEMTVTNRHGRISRAVRDERSSPAPGALVVLYADTTSATSERPVVIRTARADGNGTFTMNQLVPATYRLLAVDRAIDGEWESRRFFDEVIGQATSVTVIEDASADFSLRLMRPAR